MYYRRLRDIVTETPTNRLNYYFVVRVIKKVNFVIPDRTEKKK